MNHPVDIVSQSNNEFSDLKVIMYEAVQELNAKVILETGTYLGNSTRIWSFALEKTGGEIWTVDINPPSGDVDQPNIHVIQGDSLTFPWNRIVDVLFLDSDHRYEHVSKEINRLAPFVRLGGRILLHDYLNEGTQPGAGRDIRKATEEFASKHHLEIKTFGSPPWGMGVLEVTHPL